MEISEETIARETKAVNDILCQFATETSVILERSFESQVLISRKIIQLENDFKDLQVALETQDYSEIFGRLNRMKTRMRENQKRIAALDKRLKNIESLVRTDSKLLKGETPKPKTDQ